MSYVINQVFSRSKLARHSWGCDHSFNFHIPKIILNTNDTSELDFLENLANYLNHEITVNKKSDCRILSDA